MDRKSWYVYAGQTGHCPKQFRKLKISSCCYHKIASFYAQLCGVEVDTSGRMLAALACSLTIRIFISIPMPQLSSWNSHRCSSSLKEEKGIRQKEKTTAPDNNPLTEQVALNHSPYASLMVTLNYYHNKSEKYVTGNRNNYLHCLAAMYNRYGHPRRGGSFYQSQFTDLPADEMDAIGSAYGHNEEFDTAS